MKTVKIKGNESQGGFVPINESDFDPKTQTIYGEKAEKKPTFKKAKK